jgi:hypothetical protein
MGVDTMNSEFGRGPSPDRGHSANCCRGHQGEEHPMSTKFVQFTQVHHNEPILINTDHVRSRRS